MTGYTPRKKVREDKDTSRIYRMGKVLPALIRLTREGTPGTVVTDGDGESLCFRVIDIATEAEMDPTNVARQLAALARQGRVVGVEIGKSGRYHVWRLSDGSA